jgi:dihydrolipoamide dehydrogenase
MKTYDLIVIGTGSAMNLVEPYLHRNPEATIAVIDKDEPGGICLTRGCIPSKILLYPAELIRTIQESSGLGIEASLDHVHFNAIMERMRLLVSMDSLQIKESLQAASEIDYYQAPAEFVEPYVLSVGGETIRADTIFLCTGSQPIIPDIPGLEETGYHTSDTFLELEELPSNWAIIGGGYIAAEFGFFLDAVGAEVTIVGRNPQFLKNEEPEVSALAQYELSQHMNILTGHHVVKIERTNEGEKELTIEDRQSGNQGKIRVAEILVASGRGPSTGLLKPEKGGIETTPEGWIQVNDFFETSQKGVWALGDAIGNHLFKHVANYESELVYFNAILQQSPQQRPDYRAVPHAVFTHPEIAAVGMREQEAVEEYGEEDIAIGFSLFEQTAKGMAMDLNERGYFVKVILHEPSSKILGAHIIGPQASVLIHEIITAMYSQEQRFPLHAMHIHPALSEVVINAFGELMSVADYRHLLQHLSGEAEDDHHEEFEM